MTNIPSKQDIMDQRSWIGGPTHRLQRQHIPGYQGHVPQLVSENLFAKPFSKLTAECLEERVQPGFSVQNDDRLKTMNEMEFTQPDLRKEFKAQTIPEKIAQQIQEENQRKKAYEESKKPFTIDDIPPIDRVPVIGWMGHQPKYRYPIKQVPQPPIHDASKDTAKLESLPVGFQKTLLDQEDIQKQFVETKIPVVGYTGFLSGVRAENQFGRTYNEVCKDCKDKQKQVI